jgi:phosphoribosylformylglycinamidine synthase subunit PurL
MVSESQERMLAIVQPSDLAAVMDVCERWQTGAAQVGEVTDTGRIRVLAGGEVVGDAAVAALVDACPLYELEPQAPGGWIYGNRAEIDDRAGGTEILRSLLASPSVASKRSAFEQYDSIVGSRTARRPEAADAAVLAVPESGRAIAVAIDGNGRRVACDPYRGTIEAVLECAQNLACAGAEPLGVTNCLNFGNPEKPHVAWQLDQSVRALADACEALGVPVVGGNVSLYNETESGPIYPTPVIGMVGELPDPSLAPGMAPNEGDAVALVGPLAPSLAGSELAKLRGELADGLPGVAIEDVRSAIELVRGAAREGRITAAHDVSDGGIACALAEMAIAGGVGIRADLDPLVELRGSSGETALFGEGPGGFVVAGSENAIRQLGGTGQRLGVDVLLLGQVGGEDVQLVAAEAEARMSLSDAEGAWRSLPSTMAG